MTRFRTVVGKTLATLGVAGLAVAGAAGIALADDSDLAPGNINPTETGSLTIHKYAGTATDGENNGGQLETGPDRVPLAGVKFTICEVTAIKGVEVDLTTVDGWDALAEYMEENPTPNEADLTIGDCKDGVTGADGVLPFEGLSVGLYFVQETDPGDNPITQMSPDFLVTIPYPTGNGTNWNYNPHVYPKNQVEDDTVKAVDDESAVQAGDEVTFTVTSPVFGAQLEGADFTSYVMTDELDSRLAYVDGSLEVALYDPGANPAVNGDDLTTGFVPEVDDTTNTLTATANPGGLAAINGSSATGYVVFTFKVTVLEGGTIENMADVNGIESNTVETKWGTIELLKTDKGNSEALAGAEFEVYAVPADTTCNADVLENEDAVQINSTFTTGRDGKFVTDVIKAGTLVCFVETKAPAGYVLPEGDAAWFGPETIVAKETVTATVPVENTKHEGPPLPPTGAQGTLMLTIGGVALVLIAGGLMVASRRRTTTES